MWVGRCGPKVIDGTEHLPPRGKAALLVSNHNSWFDIPMIAQAVPNPFKYLAAAELKTLPLVGQQLAHGNHVLIDRSTKRGRFRAFKESVAYLQRGVSIMAFPEGTRSHDGTMQPFKGGVFSMELKARRDVAEMSPLCFAEMSPRCGHQDALETPFTLRSRSSRRRRRRTYRSCPSRSSARTTSTRAPRSYRYGRVTTSPSTCTRPSNLRARRAG